MTIEVNDWPIGPLAPEPVPPVLELVGVRASYGPIQVLHGVDLTVHPGQVVALLGPNGGGKTTTVKVAAGLLPLTGGVPRVRRPEGQRGLGRDRRRHGVCLILEGRGVFANLSVRENLWLATGTGVPMSTSRSGRTSASRSSRTAAPSWPARCPAASSRCSALSWALATDPAVLLLDEPVDGVSRR